MRILYERDICQRDLAVRIHQMQFPLRRPCRDDEMVGEEEALAHGLALLLVPGGAGHGAGQAAAGGPGSGQDLIPDEMELNL